MKFWELIIRSPEPGEPAGGSDDDKTKTTPDPPADPPVKDDGDPDGDKDKDTDPRVAKAREEAISERKKRQALQKEIEDIKASAAEGADLKEKLLSILGGKDEDDPVAMAENAKVEAAAATARAESALIKAQVVAEASKAGAVDPEVVARLIDQEGISVDLEKGTVTGAEEAVKALLEEKTYLTQGTKPAPNTGGSPPGSDPNPKSLKVEELKELQKKAKAGDSQALLEVTKRLGEFRDAGL